MNTNILSIHIEDMKTRLQTLWIFVMFNYLYCDVISNMESTVLTGIPGAGRQYPGYPGIYVERGVSDGNPDRHGSLSRY